ncbi:MAG: hypothetical protein ABJA37_00780 [Ferruginibacter sp.]
MKTFVLLAFIFSFSAAKAQKIESIYVNLYTDSLKKGTYNYINIDGLLADGRYQPLDSTQLTFSSNYGKFYGNSLWVDRDFKEEKIAIKVVMKNNKSLSKDFVMYIKKKEDNEHLKTNEEILQEIRSGSGKRKKN